MFGVLMITLLITIALVGSNMDIILKQGVVFQVRSEITENPAISGSFSSVEGFEEFIQSQIDQRIKNLGLEEPWYSPQRIGLTMYKILLLDFGHATFLSSDSGSSDVKEIIGEKLPRTILLFTTATIIISIIGIFLGALSGSRVGSLVDRITSSFAIISSSFLVWWIGILMIFFVCLYLPDISRTSNTGHSIIRPEICGIVIVPHDFTINYDCIDWVWFMGISGKKFHGRNYAGRLYHCKKNDRHKQEKNSIHSCFKKCGSANCNNSCT